MASIRGKNTKPELIVRRMLWSCGKRYRIHDKTIFGRPDISIRTKKLAIFIDGCFWHGCKRCYKKPSSNIDYWKHKILTNKARRELVRMRLLSEGWIVLEFWEHEITDNPEQVCQSINTHLNT